MSAGHFILERLGFEGFRLLEARGICKRFIPNCKRPLLHHPEGNFLTVFIPYVLMGTIIARCWFGDMVTRMEVILGSTLGTLGQVLGNALKKMLLAADASGTAPDLFFSMGWDGPP